MKTAVFIKKSILNFINNNWDKIILFFLIFAYILIFSRLSILRHNSFSSYVDLTNMDNTIWNTINGRFFSLRIADDIISRFSIHADLLLVLLSPIYLILDDIRLLLIVQSSALGFGGIYVYLLSLKVLKNKLVSLILVIVYLLNPGMQWTNIYDFHPVSFAIPFLLAVFYYAYLKKWKPFLIFCFLALITKEEISLIISLIGLFVIFIQGKRKLGLFIFLSGLIWFFGFIFIIMPLFKSGQAHWALNEWYSQFLSILKTKNIFTIIRFLIQKHTSQEAINYLIALFKPFSFLPLIGFPLLIFALPELSINLISSQPTMRLITYHYDSAVTPFLIISSIFGIYFLNKILLKLFSKKKANLIQIVFYLGILLIAVRVNYHYSPLPTTPSCWCFIYHVTKEDQDFEKVLSSLPKNAIVTSSIEIRPHINHRYEVYTIPSAVEFADYIALINQNRLIGNLEPKILESELAKKLDKSPNHKLIYKNQHFSLYQKI